MDGPRMDAVYATEEEEKTGRTDREMIHILALNCIRADQRRFAVRIAPFICSYLRFLRSTANNIQGESLLIVSVSDGYDDSLKTSICMTWL